MVDERNYPMSGLSSMGVGGVCDRYCVVDSEDELMRLLCEIGNGEYFMLGGGTNVVFGDEYHGTIVKLGQGFKGINAMGTRLVCGGSASLSGASKMASDLGLAGLSGVASVPGTVGGGVKGNAGAFGFEVSDAVEWVEITSRKGVLRVNKSLCGFEYRKSKLPKGVITKVCFKLEKGDKNELKRMENDFRKRRIATQPCEKSCGSLFKRAMGTCVSQKIDEAGLKGLKVGGLEVSKVHAGFIVNEGGGKPSDFVEISSRIENVLYEKFKLRAEREVLFVGELKE